MEAGDKKIRYAAAKDAVIYPIKLLIKNTIPLIGLLFLFFAGRKANHDGYEKRILIIFAGGIGDVVKRSIICGYVKEYLAGYEVCYLMPYDIALPYAQRTIRFDYKKAKVDPRYYFSLVNDLRRIGFSRVVVLLPAWEGFLASLGKDILPERVYRYVESSPKELLGFASLLIGWIKPRSKLFFDIPLVSFYDKQWKKEYFPSDVYRMAQFFSGVVGDIDKNLTIPESGIFPVEGARTEVVVDSSIEKDYIKKIEDRYNVDIVDCCLIGLGSSTMAKNWPVPKFIEIAKYLQQNGMKVILIDHIKDAKLIDEFTKGFGSDFLNLGVESNLREICMLIKNARLLVSNDTSFVHFAVALRAPSVCMCRNHQVGADSCYGYPGLNKWVFGDRIGDIEIGAVKEAVDQLLSCKNNNGVPEERFAMSFFEQ